MRESNRSGTFKSVLLLLVLSIVLPIGCTKESPIPTAKEWKEALEALGERVATDVFYHHFKDTGEYKVDFFVRNGHWYSAIISARKNDIGLVESYVGYGTPDQVYYVDLDTTKFLTGDFAQRYDSLTNIDSCWKIIDSAPYWNNDGLQDLWNIKKIWVSSSGTKGEFYGGIGIEHLRIRKKRARRLHLGPVAEWSTESKRLDYNDTVRSIEFVSPDSLATIMIDGMELKLKVLNGFIPGLENFGVSALAEIGWSPDSKAFFVNQSYGGEVGEWVVSVFLWKKDGIEKVKVDSIAVKDYLSQYSCNELESPNVGAVSWLDGSDKLLLVTEVPPHSSCEEMGKLGGYVVSVPDGQLFEKINEKELREKYREYLGKRFEPCRTTDSLEVFLVDEKNKRVFVGANRFQLSDVSSAQFKLLTVKEYVVRCLNWEDDWSVSYFSNGKFAGYKTDSEILPFVKDGSWAKSYLAEYNSSTKQFIRFPAIPDSRETVEINLKY